MVMLMDILKKEWKSIVIVFWLFIITLFLFSLNGKLNRLQAKTNQVADVLETVEGVVLGSDAGVQDLSKRMQIIESHVNHIVQKLRRR